MQVEEERDGTRRQRCAYSQCYLSPLQISPSIGQGLSQGAKAKPDTDPEQLTPRTGKLPQPTLLLPTLFQQSVEASGQRLRRWGV